MACARLIVHGLELAAGKISAAVFYPPGPTNDDGSSAFAELAPTGYLHHSGLVPPQMPWPVAADGSVTVDITIQPPSVSPVNLTGIPVDAAGSLDYTHVSSRDDEGAETLAQRTLPSAFFSAAYTPEGPGDYTVTLTATDAHGNTGQATLQFTLD